MFAHMSGGRRRRLAATSALLAALAMAPAAFAQEAVTRFSVPAQPLGQALLQLSQQARVSIAAPQNLVAGKRSNAVQGELSARDALSQLLDGSGLTAEFVSTDAVRIVPAPFREAAASPAMIEEVLVTATKRPENAREIPIALTALNQRALERLGPTNAQDAMKFVPGVNFNSNGANSVNYTIRGVNTGAATGNVQSTVAVYVDDLSVLDPYYPKITTNLRLFDVERVEVLRGPQGTLFGSGALGGAIRLVTNKPVLGNYSAAVEAGGSVTDGDEGYALNAMVNAPIGDMFALRVVGYYQREPGFVDNTRTFQTDVNSMISRGGRAQLLFAPSDRLRLVAQALFQNDAPKDSAYTNYGRPGYRFNNYQPNKFPQDLKIYSLMGEYDAGFADFVSITSYADKTEYSRIDFTARSMTITGLPGLSTISDYGPSKTFNQEFRLASKGDTRLQWLVGGLYSRNRRLIKEQVVTQGGAQRYGVDLLVDSQFRRVTEEKALFGELTLGVTDRLKLTAGVRAFDNDIRVVERSAGPLNTPSLRSREIGQKAVTPKFAASYAVTSQANLYAQAAKGFRIGQNNLTAFGADPISGEVIPREYDPDSLWNYEAGLKSVLLDGRLVMNAAAYFIDWKDIQLASRTSGTGLNYISNAGDAEIRGAELELRAAPGRGWDMGSTISYVDSELTDVRNGAAGYRGQRLPASAKYTVASYLQYAFPLPTAEAYVRLDHRYVGRMIDRLGPGALRYGEFNEFNARAGVEIGDYEVVLYANNLLNSDKVQSALAVQGASIALRQVPRTVGLTLRARY